MVQIGFSEVASSNAGKVSASTGQPSPCLTSLAHNSAERTSQAKGRKDRDRA